jgi:hypothetical protein
LQHIDARQSDVIHPLLGIGYTWANPERSKVQPVDTGDVLVQRRL